MHRPTDRSIEISDAAIGPDRPPEAGDALQLFVEQATEYACFALSPDGLVSTWNVGSQRIKGYTAEEIIGGHFSLFYLPADRESGLPDRLLEEAVTHGRVSTEGWRVRRDGSVFWAGVTITAVTDGAGRLRGFTKLTRDETDRRRAGIQAANLERLAEVERIAGELGQSVVQSLFSVSLKLRAVQEMARGPALRPHLEEAIAILDTTITDVRKGILGASRHSRDC
jgi:PAS domain S-box-containing protein